MGTASLIVYGIPNCDSVKKARARLKEQGIEHVFHDYKKQGVPTERLAAWAEQVGWEKLLNRQGTTWRKLEEDERAGVVDDRTARALMEANPSLIKRPVIERDGKIVTVGFDSATTL